MKISHAILLLLLSFSQVAAAEVSYLENLLKAKQLFENEKYEEALPFAQKALEVYQNDSDVWLAVARGEFARKKWKESIRAYKKAIEIGARAATPWHLAQIGRAYAQLRNKKEAYRWLNLALDAGYEDRIDFQDDPYLKILRRDKRFVELSGLQPLKKRSRIEQWHYDIDYFVREVRRLHPNPYFRLSRKDFEGQVDVIKSFVGQRNDQEMLLDIQKFIGSFGDGHTGGHFYYFPIFDGKLVPLRFAFFDDGIYIVDASKPYRKLFGKKVLKIGNIAPIKVFEKVKEFIGRDNEVWPLEFGTFLMRSMHLMKEIEATKTLNSLLITVEDEENPKGKVWRIKSSGFQFFKDRPFNYPSFYPSKLMDKKKTPLWLSRPNKHYWVKAKGKKLYFQFNRVRDEKDISIRDFNQVLKTSLRGKDTLIIDLRLNAGGNTYLTKPLMQTIMGFQSRSDKNKIFVVIGRRTFSAAHNFATDLERLTDAVLVGEYSGSSPNFYGESTSVVLPYAGVTFSVTSRYWQTSNPGDFRPFLAPKIPIAPMAKDYFSGEDPVLKLLF